MSLKSDGDSYILLFELSSAPEVLLITQMSEGLEGDSTMLPKKTLNDQSQTIISNQFWETKYRQSE